jgi:hypothetical protein
MKEKRAGGSYKCISGRVGKRVALFISAMAMESTMEEVSARKKIQGFPFVFHI